MNELNNGRVLPILFNTEMVRAILGGKTATRRLIKLKCKADESGFIVMQNWGTGERTVEKVDLEGETFDEPRHVNPPYKPGDILYVRETWERLDCCSCVGDYRSGECFEEPDKNEGCYVYRATHEIFGDAKWHPSIHMPKEAARIWLKVTDVRVERLQDITEEQALKEGAKPIEGLHCRFTARDDFSGIWQGTIKKQDIRRYGWNANPWVWVIEFERCEKPESEG